MKIIQKMPCYQKPKGKATVSENPVFNFHICLQGKQYKWIKDLK